MPLIRSRLPSAFKIATVPIMAWTMVGWTYVWPIDSEAKGIALEMMRGAAWPVAILGTLYLSIALMILKRWKVSDAK